LRTFCQYLEESKNAQATLARLRAEKKRKETEISKEELARLEKVLDALFKHLNIDIEFTRHFFERVNDARNKKNITIEELNRIFQKAHEKYGLSLINKPNNFEAVLKSVLSKINIPFVLRINKNGIIELIAKTVMRKANFKTRNPELKV